MTRLGRLRELLLLLQPLAEAGLNLGSRLLDQSLLRRRDHPPDHVAADGAVEAGGNVAEVPLVVLDPQFRRNFLLQALEGLRRLGHEGPVALLALGHAGLHLLGG